jgi:hypothetical protein
MRRAGWSKWLLTGVVGLFIILSLSSTSASSANISRSYRATANVQAGSIVSVDAKRTDYVEPANTSNSSRLLGVAVAKDDSLLAVNETDGKVQVATSGIASTLVSTLNGEIKVGDRVAVSAFSGIGMKSLPGAHFIGVAQSDFNGSSADSTSVEVTDRAGKKSKVKVGYVRLTVQPGVNNTGLGNVQLNDLQRLAKSLTGRTASTPRVVMSMVVALLAIITIISLIYGSIQASIISIGRNPLAKHVIFRALRSLSGMVLAIAVIAIIIIAFLFQ